MTKFVLSSLLKVDNENKNVEHLIKCIELTKKKCLNAEKKIGKLYVSSKLKNPTITYFLVSIWATHISNCSYITTFFVYV